MHSAAGPGGSPQGSRLQTSMGSARATTDYRRWGGAWAEAQLRRRMQAAWGGPPGTLPLAFTLLARPLPPGPATLPRSAQALSPHYLQHQAGVLGKLWPWHGEQKASRHCVLCSAAPSASGAASSLLLPHFRGRVPPRLAAGFLAFISPALGHRRPGLHFQLGQSTSHLVSTFSVSRWRMVSVVSTAGSYGLPLC